MQLKYNTQFILVHFQCLPLSCISMFARIMEVLIWSLHDIVWLLNHLFIHFFTPIPSYSLLGHSYSLVVEFHPFYHNICTPPTPPSNGNRFPHCLLAFFIIFARVTWTCHWTFFHAFLVDLTSKITIDKNKLYLATCINTFYFLFHAIIIQIQNSLSFLSLLPYLLCY